MPSSIDRGGIERGVIERAGIGLRSGRMCRIALQARPGPFAFRVGDAEARLESVCLASAERTTALRVGAETVFMVEHLLAACGALGLHEGLAVEVVGGEVPLLDGASTSFVLALQELNLPAVPPPLHVTRDATIRSGGSRYAFVRGEGDRRASVSVELSFDDPRLGKEASWDGTASDFDRIRGARTFAFAHEVAGLAEKQLASHVDPASVVVVAPQAILSRGAPFAADEPARHKLLDLMGDLFLYGGPPRGEVHAYRPGHAATHGIMRMALDSGVVARAAP